MGGSTKTLGLALGACIAAAQLAACAASSAGAAPTGQDASATATATEPAKLTAPAELRGLYTPAQAARGEQRFMQLCADCHGTDEITRSWFSGTVHHSAGDLFTVMSTTMPAKSPGSLGIDAYADILAYLLQLNEYPSGDAELPTDPELLARIPIPVP